MLRISKLTDYGTLVMTHMASFPGRQFSANEIALALNLGVPTVSKVLKSLGRHGLVTSIRGLRGGYALSRPAREITVADIVDALEDKPFGLTECSALSGLCNHEDGCGIRTNWQRINLIVRRALEEVRLDEMVRPAPVGHTVEIHPVQGPVTLAKRPAL